MVERQLQKPTRQGLLRRLTQWAKAVRRDAIAVWIAARDPRVTWYAKVLAGAVAAYALSPIDLIPDFVPVLGYLDDLLIVPTGIVLTLRLIPGDLIEEFRAKAAVREDRRTSILAACATCEPPARHQELFPPP